MTQNKSSLKTNLSVQQIQLALHDSFLFDQRSSVIVPNISWGMLPYEADLIGISKNGQVTEVEIKRSLSDLRADYKKGHRHDAPCVTYFYYCVPESLVEQAKKVILENEQKRCVVPIGEKDCPALLFYTEEGEIRQAGFGAAKRFGYHQADDKDVKDAGRLVSLRYWDLARKLARPEDFGAKAKIRELQDENRILKFTVQNIEEDYNMLKRMLRHRYPALWEEFLEIGHIADQETAQSRTMDAIDSRKNDFIDDIIKKYNLKGREGVEIRTKSVCQDSLGDAHPTDDLITEVLYKDHLIAMIYERRDGMNWTETNCVDFKPLLD